MSTDRQEGEAAAVPGDYRHVRRLAILLVAGITGAAGLRWLAVPATFGQEGHYRGAALAELAEQAPQHQGEAACAACHPRQVALHDKDAHTRLQCEVCHGPGMAHAVLRNKRMKVPRGNETCLACHQRLEARPSSFPQIEPSEHYRTVGVKDPRLACTACHDPHEPLFMDRDLRKARLHPLVHRCRDCHTGPTRDPRTPRPASHPAIFECSYCHQQLAQDFAGRTHRQVACTTCHLFFKESEFAGRIIRDADPRFCLLCHRQAEFRGANAPPGISWPQHRDDAGGDARARCVDCHQDHIHTVRGGPGHGP